MDNSSSLLRKCVWTKYENDREKTVFLKFIQGNSLSAPSTVVKTGVIERKKSIRVSVWSFFRFFRPTGVPFPEKGGEFR